MMKFLAILVFIGLPNQLFGESSQKALQLLDLTTTVKEAYCKAEYCPDNTCDILESRQCNIDAFNDYLLLYFYYDSDYVYLKKWKNNPKVIAAVKKIENPSYQRRKLYDVLRIQVSFVRYDEMKRISNKQQMYGTE